MAATFEVALGFSTALSGSHISSLRLCRRNMTVCPKNQNHAEIILYSYLVAPPGLGPGRADLLQFQGIGDCFANARNDLVSFSFRGME